MHIRPLLLTIVAILIVGSVTSAPSFSIGVPNYSINAAFQEEIPAIALDLQNIPVPDHCCWDDVSMKHVHLMFQGIAVQKPSVSITGAISSQPSGLVCSVSGQFETTFFYRLCLHDDPFGSGCSTLDNCKGNGDVTSQGAGGITLHAYADATGLLRIDANAPEFKANLPQHNLCGKIESSLEGQLPTINAEVLASLPTRVAAAIAKLLKFEPQTIKVSEVLSVTWALGTTTGTNANGLILEGTMDSLATEAGNKPGPYLPRLPIPSASEFIQGGNDVAALVLSDSVLTNMLWAYFVTDNTPITHEIPFLGQNVTATLLLTDAPQIQFTSQAAPNNSLIVFTGNVSLSLAAPLLDVSFVLTSDTNITVNADSTLTLQVGLYALNVTVDAGMPIDPAVIERLATQAIQETILPKINSILAMSPLPLPTVKFLELSAPKLSYGDGYILIQDAATIKKTVQHVEEKQAVNTLACPAIKGAHLDDCKT